MHPLPPSSIHLYPAPSISTQLISAFTQLSATHSTLLEPKYSRNWAIFPNLSRKIQSCSFWLKIGSHGILGVLIPNSDLDFWNCEPRNPFLGKFGPKKSKLSVLPENWHTWSLEDADSSSDISFMNIKT